MTIWVVEQGSYSDYRVVGVFSTKENADKIAALLNVDSPSDEATVDEWVFDPGIKELNAGKSLYFVQMQKDGTVERVQLREFSSYELRSAGRAEMWRRSTAPAYRGGPNTFDVMWMTCWAKDETSAIKITNERRSEMIASGKWDQVDA